MSVTAVLVAGALPLVAGVVFLLLLHEDSEVGERQIVRVVFLLLLHEDSEVGERQIVRVVFLLLLHWDSEVSSIRAIIHPAKPGVSCLLRQVERRESQVTKNHWLGRMGEDLTAGNSAPRPAHFIYWGVGTKGWKPTY